jgi:hypothetical protein
MFSAVVNKPNTLAATLAADAHEQLANTGQVRNANVIAPFLSPPAIALIDRAIGYVRPHLDRSISVSNRISPVKRGSHATLAVMPMRHCAMLSGGPCSAATPFSEQRDANIRRHIREQVSQSPRASLSKTESPPFF